MAKNNEIIKIGQIQTQIYAIRGVQVMLDRDLANLYNVPIKRLNEQVKRNINRFPKKFRFQLTKEEFENLKFQFDTSNLDSDKNLISQNVISNSDSVMFQNSTLSLRSQNATLKKERGKHRKYLPYVFTEQGVSMLSAVLRSNVAVKISIQIIDAFVEMRNFLNTNAQVFSRLDKLELQQLKTNKKFHQVFKALENKKKQPKQGIFFNGQIFDAYILTAKIIKSAKNSIILFDNYIDESVLQLFAKRNKKVKVAIYTARISKTLKQDLEKYNKQYQNKKIEIKLFKKAHDRFLIIDEKTVYHFGASLKDLGKKWFAFSKFDRGAIKILGKVKK